MLRSMFYMATAVLLSTKTARSGSYLNTESLTSYTCSRYQVFPNLSCTLEPHVTSILEIIVNWYCTISMIAQEREKLKKDEFSTNIPNQGNSFSPNSCSSVSAVSASKALWWHPFDDTRSVAPVRWHPYVAPVRWHPFGVTRCSFCVRLLA